MKSFVFNLKSSELANALRGVSADIESGFSEQQIQGLVSKAIQLGIGEETRETFNVEYTGFGERGLLTISVSPQNSNLTSITFNSDIDGLIDEIEGLIYTHYDKP